MLNWLPIVMTGLGGALTLVGGIWLGIRQVRGAGESSMRSAKILDAAQDAAARSGNLEYQRQLIELRTQLLVAERKHDGNMVKNILAQVPALTDQFDKLADGKAQTIAAMSTDFRLCWTPTISFAIAEFDRCITELKSKGIQFEEIRRDEFALTDVAGDVQSYSIRIVSIGDVTLFLTYRPPIIEPLGMQAASLTFKVVGRGSKDPHFSSEFRMDFNEGVGFGKRVMKPKDGIPPIELTNNIREAIGKGIEGLLVVSASKRT